MKHQTILVLMVACASALVQPVGGQDAASLRTNEVGVTIRRLFAGTLVLKAQTGELKVPVTVSGVSIENRQAVSNLKPLVGGLAVVEFTGGKIETEINGRVKRRKGAEFTILTAGAAPIFRTDDDSAGLRIILFEGPLANLAAKPIDLESSPDAKYKEASPGLLELPSFPPVTLNNYVLEGQNLLVGPRQKTEEFTFDGAALLEVQAGTGMLIVNGRSQRVKGGTTITVSQGQRLRITNQRDDLGLSIRATIIRAQ